MLQHVQATTASSAVEVPWEAQLAEALLIVHKAQQAEGDRCTPGLSLLFEDSAFAKLSATSTKVKAAAATLKRLQRQHADDLRGQDIAVGSTDFEALLATFVESKVLHLQVDLERLARVRMDVDALLPSLAERPGDQARLMKVLQRSAGTISLRVERLRAWVTGEFVPADLLSADVLSLRETAHSWDAGNFQRGVFPWCEDESAVHDLTVEQLISRLVLHSRERRRCTEEIQLIKEEKELILRLYTKQACALNTGLQRCEQELEVAGEESSSDGAGQPIRERVAYLKGKRLLMEDRLLRVQQLSRAATRAFGCSSTVAAMGEAEVCAPDYLEDGEEAALVFDEEAMVETDEE